MTFRNRKLLDLAHEAPCMLHIPCHSDNLKHGRGVGHKSHDCFAVPGCPNCHARFTREYLGRGGYDDIWAQANADYQLWLWQNEKVRVA